ncbi:MAG: hypothetical protein GX589_02245 [Deltaproteobacteria bacterium]|nr:hypothetical protein [Deltaproteobacteria bacterium]
MRFSSNPKASLRQIVSGRYACFCVGSLPFSDAQQAVEFVLARPKIMPFWPELPQRSSSEFMLARTERVAAAEWSGYAADESSGLYALAERLGQGQPLALIKAQLMGPLSFMSYSQGMHGSFADNLEMATAICLKQVLWQRTFLKPYGKALLFVLDEPALKDWDRLDDSEKTLLREAYSYLYVTISDLGGLLGLHSCSGFELEFLEFPIELLSFDLTAHPLEKFFCASAKEVWRDALQRGLVLAPGTFESVGTPPWPESFSKGRAMYDQAVAYLSDLGVGDVNALMSASCGHANAHLSWLEQLYNEFGT